MRLIHQLFLNEAAATYPKAKKWLENFKAVVKAAEWESLEEVRKSYPSCDGVKVGSKSSVYVFNVCGNSYRLIAAIHFNRGIVYTLRFLSHADYSKNEWKNEL